MIDPNAPDKDEREATENETKILGNQDETDTGDVNADDMRMGAGPTELDESLDELDVKSQMDYAQKQHDFPNRAQQPGQG